MGIISGLGSFRGQFGDHFRVGDHFGVIISSYPASPRRITVLVNFQAILSIFSGETSSNRDIFFTEDAAENFFPTSKFAISFFLFGQT